MHYCLAPSACDSDIKNILVSALPCFVHYSYRRMSRDRRSLAPCQVGYHLTVCTHLRPALRRVEAKTNVDKQQETVFINFPVPNGTSALGTKSCSGSDQIHGTWLSNLLELESADIACMNEASLPKLLAFFQCSCRLSAPVNARKSVISFLCPTRGFSTPYCLMR